MTDGAAGPVIAVMGGTAAGKSALAVRLALARGGEVINADSMQLYRGMDIGTAKLTPDERGGVPHHLLDIWDVRQAANVADYQRLARSAINDVTARGRVPILVGGSGLYIRAALEDLSFPGTDPAVRNRLDGELARDGAAAMHARLASLDPAAAAAILPSNGRRIVRALEVVEISGRPFTAVLPAYEASRPAVQIGVRVPRAELDRRITVRVGQMWASGFAHEVRRLEQAACGTAGPRAARSATRRCCGTWRGSGPWSRRARKPSARRSGLPAARNPGSAATPASPGSTSALAKANCQAGHST